MAAVIWVAYWTLRLAWADHLSRSAGAAAVARAVRLAPGDADFRLRLAAAQQAAGVDPTAALEAAVAADPGNAGAWMRLGLGAEMRGDPHAAENSLLEAARASRQFAPRWALANFYFRRGDEAQFWRWARESLRIGYDDVSPVFRLCWHMRPDAGLILARAIPERRPILDAYLWFLMQGGRLAVSAPVAARLAASATMVDRPALIAWCNAQLDAGSVAATLDVWNMMCARHLLSYPPWIATARR